MGWYYQNGGSRRDLVVELTENRSQANELGVTVATTCIAHCFRGGNFSGVLWTVWERTFTKDGSQSSPTERWIGCDLMRCDQGQWGFKPLDESMHPFAWSCPLGYLNQVPLEVYGGNKEWRDQVVAYHADRANKRKQNKLAAR